MWRRNMCIVILLFVVPILGQSLRIIGGHEASEEYGRFHASLQNVKGNHVCGGAVISTNHVITAAHCVYGAYARYIKVVVGTTDLDIGGQEYDVDKINIHSQYNFTLRTNDIAILRINGSFDLKYVDILNIYEDKLHDDDPIILTGFGAHEPYGDSSRRMYALNLTVFNQEVCIFAMRYTRQVTDDMFCTFTSIGQGTCHGDSGGPLVKNNQLVGLVSWGIPCAVGFTCTRITSYIPWIQQQINL